MPPYDPPPPPPEAANWERPHPDLVEYARQTTDIDAFEKEMYETLATGGCKFEDFFDEVKQRAGGA